MSDPVTNAEIEDVLSSIRRLVSEEPGAVRRSRSASQPDEAAPPPDKLVLTPALRVTEPGPDLAPDIEPEGDLEAEAADAGPGTRYDQSLEARIAELENAISQSEAGWEPDGSEDDGGDETASLDQAAPEGLFGRLAQASEAVERAPSIDDAAQTEEPLDLEQAAIAKAAEPEAASDQDETGRAATLEAISEALAQAEVEAESAEADAGTPEPTPEDAVAATDEGLSGLILEQDPPVAAADAEDTRHMEAPQADAAASDPWGDDTPEAAPHEAEASVDERLSALILEQDAPASAHAEDARHTDAPHADAAAPDPAGDDMPDAAPHEAEASVDERLSALILEQETPAGAMPEDDAPHIEAPHAEAAAPEAWDGVASEGYGPDDVAQDVAARQGETLEDDTPTVQTLNAVTPDDSLPETEVDDSDSAVPETGPLEDRLLRAAIEETADEAAPGLASMMAAQMAQRSSPSQGDVDHGDDRPEGIDSRAPEIDQARAREADDGRPAGDDTVLDEETLRQIVVELIREELKGTLGQQITRNLRRMVRREIQRAFAARDAEQG